MGKIQGLDEQEIVFLPAGGGEEMRNRDGSLRSIVPRRYWLTIYGHDGSSHGCRLNTSGAQNLSKMIQEVLRETEG